jgi:hypothetical protein
MAWNDNPAGTIRMLEYIVIASGARDPAVILQAGNDLPAICLISRDGGNSSLSFIYAGRSYGSSLLIRVQVAREHRTDARLVALSAGAEMREDALRQAQSDLFRRVGLDDSRVVPKAGRRQRRIRVVRGAPRPRRRTCPLCSGQRPAGHVFKAPEANDFFGIAGNFPFHALQPFSPK